MSARCTRCIISAAFPGADLDEEGVCSFCRDQSLSATTDETIEAGRKAIEAMLAESRGRGRYDAILCYSGGKDSTYTMKMAVQDYGLRVLSFTLDNGFLAPEALANISRVVDTLGVDHVTVKPSAQFFKAVLKATTLHTIYPKKTLTRISAGCNSCISLVNITALRLAFEHDAPFIIAGFTLGQIPLNAIRFKNNYRFFQESRKPALDALREHVGPSVDDYYLIDEETLDRVESYPTNLNLLCLEDIDENEIVRRIEPLGWQAPEGLDGCSSNCRLNTFNNHVHEKRFGYSPYELELSHLIRTGLMTREEALAKVADQPRELLGEIFTELGMGAGDVDEATRQDAS